MADQGKKIIQKQNPAGYKQGFGLMNWFKNMFNAFVNDAACGGPKETVKIPQSQKFQRLSRLPLFFSFLRNHIYAIHQKCYPNDSKCNSKRQGQILKEITRKTDTDDVCAKIAKDFGHKFPGFFIKKVTHDKLLSLLSVSESSFGETTAIGRY